MALGVEVVGVLVIVCAILLALLRVLKDLAGRSRPLQMHHYQIMIGKGLQLGLEFMVAADIMRTVAVKPTMQDVAILGALVVVRTFLSWAVVIEGEGRWTWQPRKEG
jgi:uncharacterized membrane protein